MTHARSGRTAPTQGRRRCSITHDPLSTLISQSGRTTEARRSTSRVALSSGAPSAQAEADSDAEVRNALRYAPHDILEQLSARPSARSVRLIGETRPLG